MNLIPATILDNFLENPNEVRKWALSLPYPIKNLEGKFPGKRTRLIENINPPFHQNITKKFLFLLIQKML